MTEKEAIIILAYYNELANGRRHPNAESQEVITEAIKVIIEKIQSKGHYLNKVSFV